MSGLAKVPTSVLAYVNECARRLQADPEDAEGLLARAFIFAALGRRADARESLLQLAKLAPTHPAILRVETGGDSVDALQSMTSTVLTYVNECARRLERNPKDADALFARAAILATMGQPKDALHSLEVLAKVAPEYPAVWRLKARLYKEIGDESTAALCVQAAERFEQEQEDKDHPRKLLQPKDAELISRFILNESR